MVIVHGVGVNEGYDTIIDGHNSNASRFAAIKYLKTRKKLWLWDKSRYCRESDNRRGVKREPRPRPDPPPGGSRFLVPTSELVLATVENKNGHLRAPRRVFGEEEASVSIVMRASCW